MRRLLAGLIIMAGLAGPAAGQHPDGLSVAPASDALTVTERDTRMTVPVTIGARGPYSFIVDTGSERTVLSRELAGRLALLPAGDVRVITMADVGALSTVTLDGLSVSRARAGPIRAPIAALSAIGAPGMLGLDALSGLIVGIDFDRGVMELRPARKRRIRGGPDDIIIRAKNQYGQLIVTDARYRGKRISVVVDTGSALTVGNMALLRLAKDSRSLGQVEMMSVTGTRLTADYRVLSGVRLAVTDISALPVAFADAPPFKRFGLADTPALMLGMDVLRLFRRVEIDFANRQIRMTMPRKPDESITGFVRSR